MKKTIVPRTQTKLNTNTSSIRTSLVTKETQRPLSKIPIRTNSPSQSRSRSPKLKAALAAAAKTRFDQLIYLSIYFSFHICFLDVRHIRQQIPQKYLYQFRQQAKVRFGSLHRQIVREHRKSLRPRPLCKLRLKKILKYHHLLQ